MYDSLEEKDCCEFASNFNLEILEIAGDKNSCYFEIHVQFYPVDKG